MTELLFLPYELLQLFQSLWCKYDPFALLRQSLNMVILVRRRQHFICRSQPVAEVIGRMFGQAGCNSICNQMLIYEI